MLHAIGKSLNRLIFLGRAGHRLLRSIESDIKLVIDSFIFTWIISDVNPPLNFVRVLASFQSTR